MWFCADGAEIAVSKECIGGKVRSGLMNCLVRTFQLEPKHVSPTRPG